VNTRMRIALMSTIVATACAVVLPVGAAASSSDATALAVIATVDQDEAKVAKLALTKGMTKPAADYARMMVHDHEANLAETKKLEPAGAAGDSAAAQVAKDDAATMAKLKPLQGKAFETAYVDAMVAGHTKVLGKLDEEFLPKASDPAVKAHLRKTREAVSKHLDAAKTLQAH
jgi:putative membrane protein